MAALTPNELLQWLVKNEFLSEARAQPFFTPPAAYADALALAKELLQRNYLTPYQVNQILQGKGEELLLGPYRLLERLGEGAMGQVFKGWNPKLERLIAVKMIHKEHVASKKAMDRFRREMETAAQLGHPNIVLVRDADEIDARPYMIMDFVDGTDLSRMVKQDGPLPIGQAADYTRQAALGLQHAFERGVVHRDIKPSNLLITRDANSVVKISDFGLARFESERRTEGRLTQLGAVLGTVDYIAPEQAENAQNADVRADIYSLGCTLFFLLTGKPPFPGSTMVEKLTARISGELTDIRTYRPEVPSALSAVLTRMTARNPADRYQTPQEVAAALQPFCVTAPIPLAVPVQQPENIPLARPVVPASPAGHDPFSLSTSDPGTATGTPEFPPQPASNSAPSLAANKPRVMLYALGGGAGLVLLVILFLMVRGCGSMVPTDLYPSNASLGITLKEKERTLKRGDLKRVLFTIKRTNFSGKVDVSLDKMPEGVSVMGPPKVSIDAKKDSGEIPIKVHQFAKTEKFPPIRIRAVAKNLTAEDWLDLTVIDPAQAPDRE